MQSQINNRRIARNTVLLFARTVFVLLLTLYTSRVILHALGIEDYGVYQVVGGMISMFSVISASLSAAISRFITIEIGRGDSSRLKEIFATSIVIQFIISAVVLIVAELVGLWFLKNHMQIPDGRESAAIWVMHFSLISFVINLISVPYNACIIAHEHMKTFAYVSVIDAILKLGICFVIRYSPFDRLVTYAALLTIIAISIRLIYTIYCHRHFEESRVRPHFNKLLFREMFGFAGWNFFANSASILNNQGVSMLINVFFGVTFNAARGIASQVESAVTQLVNNFTIAVSPQITKSYAVGDLSGMHILVCRAAKFSFFIIFILALPIICEADMILHIWLKEVPEKSVLFVQLSMFLGMCDCIGKSGWTACLATGNLKKYAIVISSIAIIDFPLTWLCFALGGQIEYTYYIYIIVKVSVLVARMFLLHNMVHLPIKMYITKVFQPILLVMIVSFLPSLLIIHFFDQSYLRLLFSIGVGTVSVALTALFIGMSSLERKTIMDKVFHSLKKIGI